MILKYGMNPNQEYAEFIDSENLQVLNGNPSYINFLDALNSWQLVRELSKAINFPAATSFKHVTPSGAAIGKAIDQNEQLSYNCNSDITSKLALAYLKARGSDRLASFGDFIALSDEVDIETAKIIRSEVSDGVIAPGYSNEALQILKSKKKGHYPIFLINKNYEPEPVETRQIFGFTLKQKRNEIEIGSNLFRNIRTKETHIPSEVQESLLVGLVTLKYTQSNSLCVVHNGHAIGIGSGQQSRILCSELALSKANRWYQKTQLEYSDDMYPLNQKMSKTNKDILHDNIRKNRYQERILLNELDHVCLCSDGFFPQTDNIELAHQYGVKYIASPMGSIRDQEIIDLCNDFEITFIDIGTRLFHH